MLLHCRSVLTVNSISTNWDAVQFVVYAQVLSVVAVGGAVWYCSVLLTVGALHSRSDVGDSGLL